MHAHHVRTWLISMAAMLAAACSSSGGGSGGGSSSRSDAGAGPGDAAMQPADNDAGAPGGPARVALPGLEMGNGFDDLRYSKTLGKMIAPGNYSGNIYLVDPDTLDVETITGFSSAPTWNGSDTQGPASLDEGGGLVFVGDRTTSTLAAVDPEAGKIVAETDLGSYPDYVRYVAGANEVWVTQPYQMRVEVLSIPATGTPTPAHEAFVATSQLPEGLGVDSKRGLVFSQSILGGDVIVMDVATRSEIGTWPTGCTGMHGNAVVDSERGLLFAICRTAKVVVLDIDKDGAMLDSFDLGPGAGLPAYAPDLGHFYLRGDPGLPIAVLDVADDGTLSLLDTVDGTEKGHCLTADDRGHFWTCDEQRGAIVRFTDAH